MRESGALSRGKTQVSSSRNLAQQITALGKLCTYCYRFKVWGVRFKRIGIDLLKFTSSMADVKILPLILNCCIYTLRHNRKFMTVQFWHLFLISDILLQMCDFDS